MTATSTIWRGAATRGAATRGTASRGGASLSAATLGAAALLLTACDSDQNGDTEAPAPQSYQGPEHAEEMLTDEQAQQLTLSQDEFPVEFEEFESMNYADFGDEVAAEMAAQSAMPEIQSCDELAGYAQDQAASGGSGSADDEAEDFEGEVAGTMAMGMWNLADLENFSLLASSVGSYEDSDPAEHQEHSEALRDCDGETVQLTQDGIDFDVTFEHLAQGPWEGVVMTMAADVEGESMQTDIGFLWLYTGVDGLVVMGMGEGAEHIEETAEAQLEKYETGL